MSDKGWHRPFDDPIPLPDGGELRTLRDAGNYIAKLPKCQHDGVRMARGDGGADADRRASRCCPGSGSCGRYIPKTAQEVRKEISDRQM